MRELCVLLGLQLRSLYGINRWKYTKNPQEKNRYRMLAVAIGILLTMAIFYVAALVYGLCAIGLAAIVPIYLTVIASLLIVVFGIFTAGRHLFGTQGYDLVASLPLSPRSILFSRFLVMYLQDWLFTLLIFLPGMVTYAVCAQPAWYTVPLMMTASLFVPAIPLVLSALLGTLVLALSVRTKHKTLIETLLMLVFVVGVMLLSFGSESALESLTPEQLADLASTLAVTFARIYPPAGWLGATLAGDGLLGWFGFLLASVFAVLLCVWVATACFARIVSALQNVRTGKRTRVQTGERRGLLRTLYVREAKRYFSSSVYVTNTIIGPILGTLAAVYFAFFGADSLQRALPMLPLTALLPFVLAAILAMMSTTSCAISMEGKSVWVVKCLPIPQKTLYDGKLLFNLSLVAPFYAVSVAVLAVGLQPAPIDLLWLCLIPALVILFSVVFGLFVNLKFHNFDWEKEEAVVKQSLSAALGGFAPLPLSLVGGVLVFSCPDGWAWVGKLAVCLVLAGLTVILYRVCNKQSLEGL